MKMEVPKWRTQDEMNMKKTRLSWWRWNESRSKQVPRQQKNTCLRAVVAVWDLLPPVGQLRTKQAELNGSRRHSTISDITATTLERSIIVFSVACTHFSILQLQCPAVQCWKYRSGKLKKARTGGNAQLDGCPSLNARQNIVINSKIFVTVATWMGLKQLWLTMLNTSTLKTFGRTQSSDAK